MAPANDGDLKQALSYGWRGGLKLVDFNEFPHLEGPLILTEISSKPLSRNHFVRRS